MWCTSVISRFIYNQYFNLTIIDNCRPAETLLVLYIKVSNSEPSEPFTKKYSPLRHHLSKRHINFLLFVIYFFFKWHVYFCCLCSISLKSLIHITIFALYKDAHNLSILYLSALSAICVD